MEPNAKQKLFFKAKTKYIGYGGSRGGGKSWAVREKCILLAKRYTNLRILLLRRTLPELEANHLMPLQIQLKGQALYRATKKIFLFNNGSFIKLGYCKAEKDALQYQGHEYDVICFEEATLFTQQQLVFISTCLRNVRTDFSPRIYYTCNPGGPGHSYIKRLFIEKDFTPTENPEEYTFIPASIYDNTVLMERDPTYISVLNNLPEELRRAHRDGDWDALSGQYFSEFRRQYHVIEPFSIPPEWDRYVTLDYGLDMTASYWIAVDFNSNCYVYKELYEKDLIISNAAERMLYMSKGENIKYYYMPPDLKAKNKDTGKSALTIFLENGIVGVITKNSRVAGWLAMKEMLKLDKNNVPRLRFFSNCKYAIRNIPSVQRSDRDPNDIAKIPHDITHAPDAIRYFCSTFISSPAVEKAEITGTYAYGELLMKGYSDAQIRKLANKGNIKIL